MEVNVINQNIFDNFSECILLNIDGDGKSEGMEGRLARAFRSLYPEVWAEVLKHRPDTIALGDIFFYRLENHPKYKAVIVASTHHHLDNLSDKGKEDVVYTAFTKALMACVKYRIKSIAAPVMVGGWRLSPSNAAMAMSNALEKITGDPELDVNICVLDELEYLKVSGTFRSLGWIQ